MAPTYERSGFAPFLYLPTVQATQVQISLGYLNVSMPCPRQRAHTRMQAKLDQVEAKVKTYSSLYRRTHRAM